MDPSPGLRHPDDAMAGCLKGAFRLPHHCIRRHRGANQEPLKVPRAKVATAKKFGSRIPCEMNEPSRGEKPPVMSNSRSHNWRSVRSSAGSVSASAASSDWRGRSRARRSLRTPPWGVLAIVSVLFVFLAGACAGRRREWARGETSTGVGRMGGKVNGGRRGGGGGGGDGGMGFFCYISKEVAS